MIHSRLDKSGECWLWKGAVAKSGYGVVNWGEGARTIHRTIYEMDVGEINGLWVLHKCDNPLCANPEHLFLGTHDDNMADMAKKGRAVWSTRKMPKEVREKIANKRRGKPLNYSTEETKKRSEAMKLRWQNDDWREKMRKVLTDVNSKRRKGI